MMYEHFDNMSDAQEFCDTMKAQGYVAYVVEYNPQSIQVRYWR